MSRRLFALLVVFAPVDVAWAQLYCGDGIVTTPEQCDQGNTISGDGCDQSCVVEPGWRCFGSPSLCQFCGNGQLEGTETCDPSSSCPLTCDDGDPCTKDTQLGDPSSCDMECVHEPFTECGDAEGCCPQGCTADVDSDCPVTCGNAFVEPGETCDPPSSCPTTCDDGDPCTVETRVGAPETCDVSCFASPVTGCDGFDGCCAEGCSAVDDADCSVLCGDGVLDPSEACDDGNAANGDGCDAFCDIELTVDCGASPGGCMLVVLPPAVPVTSPEAQSGCPIPSLTECRDPDYLDDDPCGILQSQNAWTCSTLLQDLAESDGTPVELSIIAFNIDPLGIADDVRKYAPEPVDEMGLVYVPDLYSITSQAAAKNFLADAPPDLGVDIYASWDNGPEINSCAEYAYEKFFDQTVFERLVSYDQHDARAVFERAYGPAYQDASIGTHHLNDPLLRGFDGRPYGWLFTGASRAKNAFFALPMQASLPGQAPTPGAPSLALSLMFYNFFGFFLVSQTSTNYGEVQPTWAWHQEMSETLSVEGQPTLGFLAPTVDDPTSPAFYAGDIGDDVDGADLTGLVPDTGGPPLRRYLDAELNEHHDMQRRLLQLFRDWALLDVQFAGSGWTITDLTNPPDPTQTWLAADLFTPTQLAPTSPAVSSLASVTPFVLPAEIVGGDVGPVPAPINENAARARILDELLALYVRAKDIGCLEQGLTPCDWSPKHFSDAVLHRFVGLREAAYEICNDHVPNGDFQALKNLDIPVVDEPSGPLAFFNCRIQTGSSLTSAGLEQLFANVVHCREQHALYLAAKAVLEAQAAAEARIRAIPELFDPATGELRDPGVSSGGGEQKGSKYFELDYDFEYGFDVDYEQSVCDLTLYAGGHFFTDIVVGPSPYTKTLEIVDALAELSTEDRSLDIHARLIGINLFTPIEESWDVDGERFEFDFADAGNRGTEQGAEASLTIFLGPIPLQLTIGVAGSAGVEMSYGGTGNAQGFVEGFGLLGDNEAECPRAGVEAGARAFLHIDSFAEAVINVGLAEGGVRGELLIVDSEAKFSANTGLTFDPTPPAGLTTPKNLLLDVNARLNARFHTLDGTIKLYGRLGPCPLCWKGEKPLLAWDGYHFDRVLFDQSYGVYMGDILDTIGGN